MRFVPHTRRPAIAGSGAGRSLASVPIRSDVVDSCAGPIEAVVSPEPTKRPGYEWTRNGNGATTPLTATSNQSAAIDTSAAESPSINRVAIDRWPIALLSGITVILALRYIIWRCTINEWRLWWISAPLLVAEIFTAFHILGYQYTIWPRKSASLDRTEDPALLPVFLFIPTVNEGAAILEPTLRGAAQARDRYLDINPDASVRIIICNDGFVAKSEDWQTPVRLAEQYGVECITREIGGGAKAGNIENARKIVGAIGASLIVVLDADQVAEPDFLLRTIPAFGDTSIGWVQSRQYYRNQESRVARWAEHQASLFYDQVCPGKETMNASYICGTNVVIRAAVLDEIGGFPQESITEDFAASIRTHHLWRSVYIKDVLAQGLGPMDLTGYYVQQSRWARGTIGVFLSDWRRLLLPAKSGLNFPQRVQYLLSGTHYFCGIRDLVFLSCAVFCLFFSLSPVKPVGLETIAAYLIPYIAASQLLILVQARSYSPITATMISYGTMPTLVLSFFEAITNRRVHFKVTPKSSSQQSDLMFILPHFFIVAICVGAIVHAFVTHHALTRINCIPLFWVLYALFMIAPTFLLARLAPSRNAD